MYTQYPTLLAHIPLLKSLYMNLYEPFLLAFLS